VQDLGPLLPQLNVLLALLANPPLLAQMKLVTVLTVRILLAPLVLISAPPNARLVKQDTSCSIRNAHNVSLVLMPSLDQLHALNALLAVMLMLLEPLNVPLALLANPLLLDLMILLTVLTVPMPDVALVLM
jgi:hypothetical protein